jgi:hypothetical protein
VWTDLFFSLIEQLVGLLFLTWLVFWLAIAIPRLLARESLRGSFRSAWENALPIGGLIAIVVIGRAILEWSVR